MPFGTHIGLNVGLALQTGLSCHNSAASNHTTNDGEWTHRLTLATVWVGPAGPSIGLIGHRIGHRVVPVVRLHAAMESTKAVLLLMLYVGFLLYCDATSEPQHPHPKPPPVGPFIFIYISLSQ